MARNNSKYYPIVIKGGYGLTNFGDDALMLSMLKIAMRHFAPKDIAFACKDSEYVRSMINDAHVLSYDDSVDITSDLFVYGGGTQFYSYPSDRPTSARKMKEFFRRLTGRIKKTVTEPTTLPFFAYNYFRRRVAHSRCIEFKHSAAFGIGVGPFVENSSAAIRFQDIFTRMTFIATRDVKSYAICKKWGLSNVLLRSDLCYIPELWPKDLYRNHDSPRTGVASIGIVIRDWPFTKLGDAFWRQILEVAGRLRNMGKIIQFISFEAKGDNVWQQRLRKKGEPLVQWDPQKQTIESFLRYLSTFDCFITARYHGGVFASLLGKPAICIATEQKTEMFGNLLSEGGRLWRFPFACEDCIEAVNDIETNYDYIVASLQKMVHTQQELGARLLDEIDAYIEDCKRDSA